MKIFYWATLILLLTQSCANEAPASTLIESPAALKTAMAEAEPGDELLLKNGTYRNLELSFYGRGTEAAPITLRPETPGGVVLEGQSRLHLGGEYLVVSGLHFRNGYSPGGGVIRYMIGKDSVANHVTVTDCVIENYSRPNRYENDRWVEFYGRHNQLDHCYLTGKANDGATVMVYHKGNQHTDSHHQIVHNHFGPRPRKGGPRGETMRLGGSETSMTPGRVLVADNYFERCNGEVEVISDKTNYNTFRDNIFYKCEGSLVLRHSDYTTVDGNLFIGDEDSDFYGGIRVVNTGHWITNNYFYRIRGEEFRSPLALMNGIPKSSLNRYKQVTDAVIAHNTWVDCRSPFQVGVGQNKESADVLPKSEIRSAPPARTTVANNLIYNTVPDSAVVVNHDEMGGVLFAGNIVNNAGQTYTEYDVLENAPVEMERINDWLYVPSPGQDVLEAGYNGFGFDRIDSGLFGSSRSEANLVGAINDPTAARDYAIDADRYGPSWFSPDADTAQVTVHRPGPSELLATVEGAGNGDVLELAAGEYSFAQPLPIGKTLTLRGGGAEPVVLRYSGKGVAFQMLPRGSLRLDNVKVTGGGNGTAFAPLEKGMSAPYKIDVRNSEIRGFDHLLLATYGSFADSLSFTGTTLRDCANGFVLAADEKGDYNAEMVTFTDCKFETIAANVLHFYRGGYDESTIGGFLRVTDCEFNGCGRAENSGILLKTPGIINAHLVDNTFRNNPVRHAAVLWGAKNNHARNNTLVNSGAILVEEQQAQEILY